jgi:hypothetical protein
LRRRPELCSFLDHARAERQMQDLIAAATAGAVRGRTQVIAARRAS